MSVAANVLLVSNGHGEAAIAGYIAQAVRAKDAAVKVEHLPLVGSACAADWPPSVGPHRAMPSGGLVANWNLRNFARDVRAGLLGLLFEQHRFLRRQQQRSVIVAVGDVFCLWMSLAAHRPTIFVATAKSDYVSGHSRFERGVISRAKPAFVRDAATAQSLQRAGVNARYAGNLMMDGVAASGADLGVDQGATRLAVLPGSRADAPQVCATMFDRIVVITRLLAAQGKRVQVFISIAPGVDAADIIEMLRRQGAHISAFRKTSDVIARGTQESLELVLVANAFGDVLAASHLVLGQAGTANEQAAGFGRPVVAALEPGETPEKMQWYRMRQKRLLGDALLVAPPQPEVFARAVVALLDDPQRQAVMSQAGRDRMGKAGGAATVADAVLAQLENAS